MFRSVWPANPFPEYRSPSCTAVSYTHLDVYKRQDGGYYLYADQEKDNYKWDISNGANKNPIEMCIRDRTIIKHMSDE